MAETPVVSRLDSAATHKATTVGGIALTLIGAFLPTEVRTTCMEAIGKTDSPVLTSILLISGLALTTIGPSLKSVDWRVWLHKEQKKEAIVRDNAIDEANKE